MLTDTTRFLHRSRAGSLTTIDSIKQVVTRTSDIRIDQLGQYIAPIVRITDNLFWALHAEGVRRKKVTTTRFSIQRSDTTQVAKPTGFFEDLQPADTAVAKSVTSYEIFYGTGPMVVLRRGGLELRTKSMLGIGNVNDLGHAYNYLLQFRVTDFENGFKFGGEIRGTAHTEVPTILVYLAKDFAFKRLANFLVGGDTDKK